MCVCVCVNKPARAGGGTRTFSLKRREESSSLHVLFFSFSFFIPPTREKTRRGVDFILERGKERRSEKERDRER